MLFLDLFEQSCNVALGKWVSVEKEDYGNEGEGGREGKGREGDRRREAGGMQGGREGGSMFLQTSPPDCL